MTGPDRLKMLKALKEKLYSVRVPTITTYTDFEIREIGVPSENILYSEYYSNRKKRNVLDYSDVMLPLYRIFQIFSNGYTVFIKRDEDILEIYDILVDLKENYSIYRSVVTVDMIMLDNFIESILSTNGKLMNKIERDRLDSVMNTLGGGLYIINTDDDTTDDRSDKLVGSSITRI